MKLAVLLLFFVSAPALADDHQRVSLCHIEVSDAYGPDLGGFTKTVVKDMGANIGCIDIRETGLAGSGSNFVEHEGIALLANHPLSADAQLAIRKDICGSDQASAFPWPLWSLILPEANAGLARAGSNCKVNVICVSSNRDQVRIEAGAKVFHPLPGQPIPPLTNSCKTGKYEDSWTPVGANKEATDYLVKAGGDISNAEWLRITVGNAGLAPDSAGLTSTQDVQQMGLSLAVRNAIHQAAPTPLPSGPVDFTSVGRAAQ